MDDTKLINWLASLPGPIARHILDTLNLEPREYDYVFGKIAAMWISTEDSDQSSFTWIEELQTESPGYIDFHLRCYAFGEQDMEEIRIATYFLGRVLWASTADDVLEEMVKSVLLNG